MSKKKPLEVRDFEGPVKLTPGLDKVRVIEEIYEKAKEAAQEELDAMTAQRELYRGYQMDLAAKCLKQAEEIKRLRETLAWIAKQRPDNLLGECTRCILGIVAAALAVLPEKENNG